MKKDTQELFESEMQSAPSENSIWNKTDRRSYIHLLEI